MPRPVSELNTTFDTRATCRENEENKRTKNDNEHREAANDTVLLTLSAETARSKSALKYIREDVVEIPRF